MVNRHLAAGIVLGLLMAGCAGFSYRYYGLEGVDYSRGMLLGDKPENDLPFLKCEPSSSSKHPCVVLFAPEFYKLKTDYDDTKQKLKDAEKRLAECESGRRGS